MRSGVAVGFSLALLGIGSPARAQFHRRFEPTDLDLQRSGSLEIDTQVGYMAGASAERLVVPDFEASLGLTSNVELEVDGAYAREGTDGRRFTNDHSAPDNLWISSKLAFADWRDDENDRAWTLGAQLGPKLPLANETRGPGYEALLLFGRTDHRVHAVLNLGGFVDPMDRGTRRRPVAGEGGLDFTLDLDAQGIWSITAELGGTLYTAEGPHEAHGTCGIVWGVSEALDLSVVGVLGLLGDGDRGGVMLGVTPRFALWK
jgi:hypothetical protein